MKALVTGATGFVGGHLVDQLLERGDTVTALVRTPARAADAAARGVRLVQGDLGNLEALAEAAAGQDVIYHAAALTGAVDEAEFLAANRDGTRNLARAAVAAGGRARFVLVSSMAAGGPARQGEPRRPGEPDAPVTMYGRSKLASEVALTAEPLTWTIVRPPTIYGPRDRDNLLTVFKAARLGIAPVFGSGSMELSLVHVVDLADSLIRAATSDAARNRLFYVNHPEVITSAELVRGIGREMGRTVTLLPIPEWLARVALHATGAWAAALQRKTILRADKANEFYQDAWTGDASDFVSATGWAPRWDFAQGIADTAAWYRAAQWL
ncbi:MAG: NAD-dependent epimerase/dehydratase family protein [Gemmatimonadota bacterium]